MNNKDYSEYNYYYSWSFTSPNITIYYILLHNQAQKSQEKNILWTFRKIFDFKFKRESRSINIFAGKFNEGIS